jgi:hypothetical protein
MAKIGYVVSLEVGNLAGWLEKLKTDKVITSGETDDALVSEQLPNLRLFIGEHLMKTLYPTGYIKDDPAWYPADPVQEKAALGRSWLEFTLKRDAANKVSRADWDPVLRTPGISPKMDLAVGIYDGNRNTAHVMALPVGADTADPQLEFHLQLISWEGWTLFGLILLAACSMTGSQSFAVFMIGPIPILSVFFWRFRRRLSWKKRIVISVTIYALSYITTAVVATTVGRVGHLASPTESAIAGITGGILAPLVYCLSFAWLVSWRTRIAASTSAVPTPTTSTVGWNPVIVAALISAATSIIVALINKLMK